MGTIVNPTRPRRERQSEANRVSPGLQPGDTKDNLLGQINCDDGDTAKLMQDARVENNNVVSYCFP
jgi:hypothetical protein